MIGFSVIVLIIILWLILERALLIPEAKGVRILLYHRVNERDQDGLTLHPDIFEKHLSWLRSQGYQFLSGQEFTVKAALPAPSKRMVLITFDDGYLDNLQVVVPILKKHQARAVLFLTTGMIGKPGYLTADQVRELVATGVFEVAYHSHTHGNYGEWAVQDFQKCEQDLQTNILQMKALNIPVFPWFAYPFGSFARRNPEAQNKLEQLLSRNGMTYAYRIGNRVALVPHPNPYQIPRIDIKRKDSFSIFKIKVKKGRAKLFA